MTFESNWCFDPEGRPLNPRGRTGMRGRGLLGKWGPNHAADPIVTRFHPETGVLQLVAILRADVRRWALPGGMVEAGQGISGTIRRDFEAEVGVHDAPEEKPHTYLLWLY